MLIYLRNPNIFLQFFEFRSSKWRKFIRIDLKKYFEDCVKKMFERRLHKFYLSFRNEGEIETICIEGISLRYVCEKLRLLYPEATDIRDWTHNRDALDHYLQKVKTNA